MLDAALEIGEDPRAGLVDKVVAWQAVHRVRTDLEHRAQLLGVQCQLVQGLEDLNDPAAAYRVAAAALAEYLAHGPSQQQILEQDDLAAAVLRLARTQQSRRTDPLINATITAAAAGGAATGLEARIWAAIDLLDQPRQRERALELTDQITAELSSRDDLGAVGNRWRLLLAFHVGRAGYPAIAQQLLIPMLNASDSSEDGDAARAVLYAVGGPAADTRLQIVGLEAELAALLPDADDDRLRVHLALAADYGDLGDYRRALHHGQQELPLRRRMQGADHPDTLTTRGNIAFWTGRERASGGGAAAVPGAAARPGTGPRPGPPRHPGHLRQHRLLDRECGHPAEALRLFQELLPDQERVLGPDHPTP